ncbi:MAG TPA: D-aminoacylase [Planctomycetota bacterium]|nr:D-aminoacylase [Planctomycetota bacterium]
MSSGVKYDLLISGGKVVDGSGNPWFYGDVAIKGDSIAAVLPRGSIDPKLAGSVVKADGHVVCPGFIDIQSHAIVPLLSDGRSFSKITQGVTTEIMGEAWTPSPVGGRIKGPFDSSLLYVYAGEWEKKAREWTRFRAWLEAVQQRGVSVNIGSFLGGGTLREYACGWEMRPATKPEIQTMCRVMDDCMREGAFGVATALIYPPGSFAQTDELIEVAKVIAKHGGVYITHVRSEAAQLIEGLQEAIQIGRESKCAIEIYHFKAQGKSNWKLIPKAIETIEAARREGIDITSDMYPYDGCGTNLSVLIPNWASDGGKLFENLRNASTRKRIKAEMLEKLNEWTEDRNLILPLGFLKEENKKYVGKTLQEISRERSQDWADATIDLLLSEGQRIFTCYLTMSEENVRAQLKLSWMKISTDAGGHDPKKETIPVHPRAYGTYPRVLGKYVREEKVLSLEDAIRKMTWSVASRLGIADRGLLAEGMKADVVVFNPDTVKDYATWNDTHRTSAGIRDVYVNGQCVLQNSSHTGAMPGRIVDGPGKRG